MKHLRGFSLVEVLVSLVVISVGLLGIAKIQALAYSETGTSRLRSIAAIEAASLASSMRANRTFWSTAGGADLTVNVTGSTVTFSDGTVPSPATANCLAPAASCTDKTMAAYDVQQWATALTAIMGAAANPLANIACPVMPTPVTCTITIQWDERVATTATGASAAANSAIITPVYTLYVEP